MDGIYIKWQVEMAFDIFVQIKDGKDGIKNQKLMDSIQLV